MNSLNRFFIGLLLCLTTHASTAADCVVLLHGLARTEASMAPMAKFLQKHDYQVVNASYASTSNTIEAVAEPTLLKAIGQCEPERTIHVVSHSMGGILLRYYLSSNSIDNLGHVVMLGPPNHGSEVVDYFRKWSFFERMNGPAGLQLGTRENDMPAQLPAATFSLGIIAGKRSISPILSWLIPGPDDGKVSVLSTKLEGMSAHKVMPVTHTFIMRDTNVMTEVLHFLQHGKFT